MVVIIITTVDGNKKAQCTVNVEKNGGSTPPAAVTGVTLAHSDLTLKIGTSLRLIARDKSGEHVRQGHASFFSATGITDMWGESWLFSSEPL